MAVTLRFVRVGKKNCPAFRLCAMDSRKARDGQYLENIGYYDPYVADDKKKFRLNKERVEYWLGVGAQMSQTVFDFLKKEKVSGLIRHKPKRKRRKKAAAAPGAAGSKPAKKQKPPKKAKPPKKPKAESPEQPA